jgi:aspartyl-tRNA(Asn)/glutamyl-tRNA(Gln) amidotransferase subunit A
MPSSNPLEGAAELCLLDAATLAKAYGERSLSPVEVVQATLERAETINPEFNAFSALDHKGAIAIAQASERRWAAGEPLSEVDGVPTTIKDIVWVDGWSVRYGSHTTSDQPFLEDSPSVALMRKAGAVFIGQTTTPEFGWKAITDSGLCGITRNPWDRTKTPGGSSGGAAVAAAAGAGVFHLGTDGGGSIRIPASFTGIVGLKPSFGRVPAYPVSSFGTVAHIGPMTRTVSDAAAMLKVMSGRDLRDWFQGAGALASLDGGTVDLTGKHIGYWAKPPVGKVDPEVASAIDAVVEKLRTAGAVVEYVDIPGEDLLQLFHHHWFSGAALRLSLVPQAERATIDPGFLEIAAEGAAYSSTALVRAQVKRAEFGSAMDRLLERYDYLVSPGTAIPAFEAGLEVPAEA